MCEKKKLQRMGDGHPLDMSKMTKEELALWMYLRKAAFKKENKKGKGSYKRKPKHIKESD